VDQDLPRQGRVPPAPVRSLLPDPGTLVRDRTGDWVAVARCDLCWRYANPREFRDASPGGRKGAFLGMCGACASRIEDHV